jgi:hypothetical protein
MGMGCIRVAPPDCCQLLQREALWKVRAKLYVPDLVAQL